MAIQQLLETNKLSTEFLSTHRANWEISSFLDFDQIMDDLFLLFIDTKEEHIVHYIDDNVAVLYKPYTYDIIGIQIDSFQSEFSKTYNSKENEWKFINKGENKDTDWVLSLYFDETRKGLCVLLEKENRISGKQSIVNLCYPTKVAFRSTRTPVNLSKKIFNVLWKRSEVRVASSIAILILLFIIISFSPSAFFVFGENLVGSAGGVDGGKDTMDKGLIFLIVILVLPPVLLILYKIINNKKK